MQEKEKKPEKKQPPTAKGMKRNKTTINLGRNKLDKKEKNEKTENDNKLRKSTVIKTTKTEVKRDKSLSKSMRLDTKEKKDMTKKKSR